MEGLALASRDSGVLLPLRGDWSGTLERGRSPDASQAKWGRKRRAQPKAGRGQSGPCRAKAHPTRKTRPSEELAKDGEDVK